jgi:hypothetical protein
MGMLEWLAPGWVPIRGIIWIGEKIAEQAEHELYDEGAVREQLMQLELIYDMGEMSEEEYLAAEAVLLERLRVIREHLEATGRQAA